MFRNKSVKYTKTAIHPIFGMYQGDPYMDFGNLRYRPYFKSAVLGTGVYHNRDSARPSNQKDARMNIEV